MLAVEVHAKAAERALCTDLSDVWLISSVVDLRGAAGVIKSPIVKYAAQGGITVALATAPAGVALENELRKVIPEVMASLLPESPA